MEKHWHKRTSPVCLLSQLLLTCTWPKLLAFPDLISHTHICFLPVREWVGLKGYKNTLHYQSREQDWAQKLKLSLLCSTAMHLANWLAWVVLLDSALALSLNSPDSPNTPLRGWHHDIKMKWDYLNARLWWCQYNVKMKPTQCNPTGSKLQFEREIKQCKCMLHWT